MVALLGLQLVWLVAVPPFRGIDEFDHVWKAAGTARGQVLVTPSAATRGTGAWFTVPDDVVAASRFECEALPYTRPADCVGVPTADGTRVASAAGRYPPTFYAVAGLVALPFHGDGALYAMRLASIGLCLLLLGLALAAVGRWARTAWPAVLLLAACTPTVLYSSVVAAPNGAEMAAGLAFWAAGLGLLLPEAAAHRRFLGVVAGVSGTLLVSLRPIGPLWCLLAVLALLLATRPSRAHLAALLRSRTVVLAGGTVVVATLLTTWWIRTEDALAVSHNAGPPLALADKLGWLLGQAVLWQLQSVGAFPYRNQPTVPAVYFCYVLLGAGALVLGLRAAAPWLRLVVVGTVLVSVLVPYVISLRTWSTAAGSWQGRYALPFVLGLGVLVGWALDRRGVRPSRLLLLLGGLAYAAAQALSPWDVVRRESGRADLLATHAWLAPASWLVLVAALLASGLAWWAATRTGGRASPEPQAAREAATQRSSSDCAAPESTA